MSRILWLLGLTVGMLVATPARAETVAPTELLGPELYNAAGKPAPAEALKGKLVGLYFSAHWCPPCRAFTPELIAAYKKIRAEKKPFEIVLVSADRDERSMYQYMDKTGMPWLTMKFDAQRQQALGERFSVQGIPTLVILDETGRTVSLTGRGDVTRFGAAAYDDWARTASPTPPAP